MAARERRGVSTRLHALHTGRSAREISHRATPPPPPPLLRHLVYCTLVFRSLRHPVLRLFHTNPLRRLVTPHPPPRDVYDFARIAVPVMTARAPPSCSRVSVSQSPQRLSTAGYPPVQPHTHIQRPPTSRELMANCIREFFFRIIHSFFNYERQIFV